MLCPEVWNFPPPDNCNKESTGHIDETLPPHLNKFYFCHSISVVVPNFEEVRSLTNSFNEDSQYYKVDGISLDDICSKEFISHFVQTGSVTALSVNTRIDIDNSACITPEGVLVLSLFKKTYQESGLEGRLSYFAKHTKDKYIIQINLKDANILSKLQKLRQSLNKLKFDLILIWEPPSIDICPSSLASYFYNQGYEVTVCTPKFEQRNHKNIKMPCMGTDVTSQELIEWLGMFSLQADIELEASDLYTNLYELPEKMVNVEDVLYLEWKGMFTVSQVQKLHTSILHHLPQFHTIPWVSFHVQGFSDAPVSWGLQEHNYFVNGDSGYTLFVQPSREYLLYTKCCSSKIHK